jgi:type IV secretory pathway component VirB8
MNTFLTNSKNFIYVKKVNKKKLIQIQNAFIKFIDKDKKKISIKEALKKNKNINISNPKWNVIAENWF